MERMVGGFGSTLTSDETSMISRIPRIAVASLVLFAVAAAIAPKASLAQQIPTPFYYISMRGLQTEAAPTFVSVVVDATGDYSTPISACNGRSFFATSADAATIAAARANGEVVQLHLGFAGNPPEASKILCIIDAAGS